MAAGMSPDSPADALSRPVELVIELILASADAQIWRDAAW
jgi:hypothetical protein